MGASGQKDSLTSIEICAGAGGQAVGLETAGFHHLDLVEIDPNAVNTLKENVKSWPGWGGRADSLKPSDVRRFCTKEELKERGLLKYQEKLHLLAGGVPCPPFSLAGARLGEHDERDLFPDMLRLIGHMKPMAVMIENVRGLLEPPHVFIEYRRRILDELRDLGYNVPHVDRDAPAEVQDKAMRRVWRILEARDFGVPQLRPRAILVAFRDGVDDSDTFRWPIGLKERGHRSVADVLEESMRDRYASYWNLNRDGMEAQPGEPTGKQQFEAWYQKAKEAESRGNGIAPTLVGGSRKHGGADLGPTRAKAAWRKLGVDANGVANDPVKCVPRRDLFGEHGPMLTADQAALIQGFPDTWKFQGLKTAKYRQVGNAFPPPVAEAVGRAIAAVLRPAERDVLLKEYDMDPEALEPSPDAVQDRLPGVSPS
ncbi:DNA cytosine methyltransferase [Streptomyces sp. MAR4 CNY-716]